MQKVDVDVTHFKPRMKAVCVKNLANLRELPMAFGNTTVQVKADGEFNYVHVDREEAYSINRFGRKTTMDDLPALRELHKIVGRALGFSKADLLAEMYAVDANGNPLSLPNFVHYLKGNDKNLRKQIHLGLFDFTDSDAFSSEERFKALAQLNGKLVHVLEWTKPKNLTDVESFWKAKVEKQGYEGLVVRSNGETWKAKPSADVDAVIIGINKSAKAYAKGLAKSVKVALMPTENSFVEIGDATVATDREASELFGLTRVKVNEDAETVFVKPLVVVQIDYISLFPETTNRVYKLLLGGFTEIGTMKAVRMKSPRVKGYRKDKHACIADVGMNQVAE